ARHLAECEQTLLLHHSLLRLAQLVVRALQITVELGLMRGERNVLAELAQKLAFAAREGTWARTGGDQHTEHLAFDEQRRANHRPQPAARQTLREGRGYRADVLLTDEPPRYTDGQAVLINRHTRFRSQADLRRTLLAALTDAGNGDDVLRRV